MDVRIADQGSMLSPNSCSLLPYLSFQNIAVLYTTKDARAQGILRRREGIAPAAGQTLFGMYLEI
jgi:hypothetical protein